MKDNNTQKTEFKGSSNLDAVLESLQRKKDGLPTEPIKPTIESDPPEDPLPVAKEIKKEVIEPKQPEEPPVQQQAPTETEAFKKARTLIELGMLDDFAIQLSDDDENPTNISEFTDMSEENLQEIIKIHKESKNEEISSKYIEKGDLKDHQLKVIEYLKNGGNIKDIAKDEDAAYKRPFEGMDLENENHLEEILRTDLKYNKKLKDERIERHIKIAKEEGTIAEEAKEVFDSYRQMHSDYMDDMLTKQKNQKQAEEATRKENKKALKEKLKNAGLKQDVYNKVYTEYGRVNENGEFALVDKLKEALANPEENSDLILHLVDSKMFQDVYKIKSSQETQKAIVRLATSASAKGNRKSTKADTVSQDAPWIKRAENYNSRIKNT